MYSISENGGKHHKPPGSKKYWDKGKNKMAFVQVLQHEHKSWQA